jgi:HAD superfamily hydrolase (TIGR02253 family)
MDLKIQFSSLLSLLERLNLFTRNMKPHETGKKLFRNIKAVLFDLDETLIDTTKGAVEAAQAVAKKLSENLALRHICIEKQKIVDAIKKLDDEMSLRLIYDRNQWWRVLLEQFNLRDFPDNALPELTSAYWRAYSKYSLPYSDVKSTLTYLKERGYRLGLVTDSDGTKGVKSWRIAQTNLQHFFDIVVIGGEDTNKIKPHPEPFLLAIKRLGLKPYECVFVGDKPFTDIKGAKAAGMSTVMVRRREWKIDITPDVVIKEVSELRSFL